MKNIRNLINLQEGPDSNSDRQLGDDEESEGTINKNAPCEVCTTCLGNRPLAKPSAFAFPIALPNLGTRFHQ